MHRRFKSTRPIEAGHRHKSATLSISNFICSKCVLKYPLSVIKSIPTYGAGPNQRSGYMLLIFDCTEYVEVGTFVIDPFIFSLEPGLLIEGRLIVMMALDYLCNLESKKSFHNQIRASKRVRRSPH